MKEAIETIWFLAGFGLSQLAFGKRRGHGVVRVFQRDLA